MLVWDHMENLQMPGVWKVGMRQPAGHILSSLCTVKLLISLHDNIWRRCHYFASADQVTADYCISLVGRCAMSLPISLIWQFALLSLMLQRGIADGSNFPLTCAGVLYGCWLATRFTQPCSQMMTGETCHRKGRCYRQ